MGVASGRLNLTLQDTGGQFAFSPDGQTLATGSNDGTRLWDVASGQLKVTLKGENGFIISPDSKTLATASHNASTQRRMVRLWDVASGQLKATLPWDTAWYVVLVFAPDSKTLAIGTYDTTTEAFGSAVLLWDVASGQLRTTLTGTTGAFVFSPDGQTLAIDNGHGGVQVWNVASGQLRASLKDAYLLAFSSDGMTLATRDASGKLLLWDVALSRPILHTAQTSLAQFPPSVAHPFSWNEYRMLPEVWLLDPFDEHVLATLQALPDAPASLSAPPPGAAVLPNPGDEWITFTPDGYFEGSANVAAFIRWNVDGMLYPAAAYWDVYDRPDLVQQALRIPGE